MSQAGTAIGLLQRARAELGPRCLVAFSGGKDSLAVLVLAIRVYGAENVACYHLAIVPGLDCVEGRARRVAERLGIAPGEIRTYPHPDALTWMRSDLYRLPRGEVPPSLRFRDIERAARIDARAHVIASGIREDDSVRRRVMLRRDGHLDLAHRKVYPVAGWREREVYALLRVSKVPLPVRFGDRKMSGLDMTPECLAAVRRDFPDDFRRICEVFPHAEALALRQELVDRRRGPAAVRGDEVPDG